MNFFKRLFRGSANKSVLNEAAGDTNPPTRSIPEGNDRIVVYDAFGREASISRTQWAESVLPGAINRAWSQPDELYQIIVTSLRDGLRKKVIEASKHLFATDTNRSRATCLWSIVLMDEGRTDEAERILRKFCSQNPDDGYILANLAKVHSLRGQAKQAEQMLWHSLEVDPNQSHAVGWYWSIHHERGGNREGYEALKRIALLPGSWRAQLWLAKEALRSNQLSEAMRLYRESLARAGKPIPADLLTQISGDMGNSGHSAQMLDLVAPLFVPNVHGLDVGNNLMKAMVDLRQFDRASAILESLFQQRRSDWQRTLQFWETEIAKCRIATSPPLTEESVQTTMICIFGPIWLPESSPARSMVRLTDANNAPVVCFLGSSAETATNAGHPIQQLSDSAGRMSRALPLFLAEQSALHLRVRSRTLIPFMVPPHHGFVLAGTPWDAEYVTHLARDGTEPADYLVLTHLTVVGESWNARARIIRTIDSNCVSDWTQPIALDDPKPALDHMVSQVHSELQRHAGAIPVPSGSQYQVPQGIYFGEYLLRLEQLLAVRCGSMENVSRSFLIGTRSIIDGVLNLCLECPSLLVPRLILLEVLSCLNRVDRDLVCEYRDRINLLQKEKPLLLADGEIVRNAIANVLLS